MTEPLLLFSHQLELDTCVDRIRSGTSVGFRAERVGIGPRDARHRTHHLLDRIGEVGRPTMVLALGSAGWLRPGSPPLGPVWATEVTGEDHRVLRPTLTLPLSQLEAIGLASVRLLTVRRAVTAYNRAIELAETYDADVVDMESSAILSLCIDRRVPCACIRSVTDRASAGAVHRYRETIAPAMQTLGDAVARLLGYHQECEQARLDAL